MQSAEEETDTQKKEETSAVYSGNTSGIDGRCVDPPTSQARGDGRSGSWQLAGDATEQAGQLLAKHRHGDDDDNGDEGNHQSVLNGGGATVTAVTQEAGDPDLELDD
jgi:hypothetical protein